MTEVGNLSQIAAKNNFQKSKSEIQDTSQVLKESDGRKVERKVKRTEGRKEGRKEGTYNTCVNLIQNMKENNLTEQEIAHLTNLDIEMVKKIINREPVDIPLHLLSCDK